VALEQEKSLAVPAAALDDVVVAMAEGIFGGPGEVGRHFSGVQLRSVDMSDPVLLADSTIGADVVMVTLQPLRAAHVRALAPSVRVIGRAGVGLDTIDLDAAKAAGITVINQPAYGVTEVASHAVAMLLALQRRLGSLDAFVREGWTGPAPLSPMKALDELVVGLIGLGRIGRATAQMLTGMVGRVIAYDPAFPPLPHGVEWASDIGSLLGCSDVVSLHVPLMPETQSMVDAGFLAAMMPGALLVNVSRGGLVDEDALASALESGQVGGAGLDVFGVEPLPLSSRLMDAPNTLLSPHCAAYSERSTWRLMSWTLEDTVSWVRWRTVEHGNIVVVGDR